MERNEAFISGLRLLMRPVIRFCLRHSIKVQEIVEVLKETLIEVAKEELSNSVEESSASRLSAMTGLHRRDVVRLIGLPDAKKPQASLVARVISQWRHDSRFLTKNGRPRVLGVDGKQSEFAELVASISKDLGFYAVLFELERLEYVKRTPKGVKLLATSHISAENFTEALGYLSRDSEDLLVAVEENVLSSEDTPNLHLKTEYDNIAPEDAPVVRRWLLEEGSRFHAKARQFLSKFDRDYEISSAAASGRVRVAVGAFSRVEKLDRTPSK